MEKYLLKMFKSRVSLNVLIHIWEVWEDCMILEDIVSHQIINHS